ncbi:MAG: SAM-dependent DNA methyltransferase [Candidatus Eisenbacteria sp.]|nr:SAM-dependent DNA methyltransferase [Candidatus Eisenbacteria bacterium]
MTALATELRGKLERAIIEARDAAEEGARTALEALAVHHHEPYTHMDSGARYLRNHLRARARQLGDAQDRSGRLGILHLVQECAYEHWHRMLFARFLAENALLIEPESQMPISLDEAEELGKESGVDRWIYASRCAERMLPQIFRPDDPLLSVGLAREHQLKLERLLNSLHPATFMAPDALGWVYQYWQSKRKAEVNASGRKIGADELPAVTQLFTEPYMVSFLIHNTLGAWWAGKKLSKDPSLATSAQSEEQLSRTLALTGVTWDYLRFVRRDDGNGPWEPAAGTFVGWPRAAADLRVLDPCCGSGHFLVALLRHLVPMRMAEEGLSAREAVDAVLRENLHGLEIDERCCQIAAFALALAAWTYPNAGGHRPLPDIRVACSGMAPNAKRDDWLASASGNVRAQEGLSHLYDLFKDASVLGTLIDPPAMEGTLLSASYEEIRELLRDAISNESNSQLGHYDQAELRVSAAGIAEAGKLLSDKYDLLVTNIPYLQTGNQHQTMSEHVVSRFELGRPNLATAFLLRMARFLSKCGTLAAVSMQDWLYKDRYGRFREHFLSRLTWNGLARLGPGAFESISGEVVNVCLFTASFASPTKDSHFAAFDVQNKESPNAKSVALQSASCIWTRQQEQLANPRCVIVLGGVSAKPLLEEHASYHNGIQSGDRPRFVRCSWEVRIIAPQWRYHQSTVKTTTVFGGMEHVFFWEDGNGRFRQFVVDRLGENLVGSWIRGGAAWGKLGVLVSAMGQLPVSLYSGHLFDDSSVAVIPRDVRNLAVVWCFMSSDEFAELVRSIDKSLKVRGPLVRVPFDKDRWEGEAKERYPNGLPEPYSDDPTQWLYHGRPEVSTAPLHVAVARLLGYRWLAETDKEMRLSSEARELIGRCSELEKYADRDGIGCIAPVRGEDPAAERLRALLAAAYGADWSPDREAALISESGSSAKDLDDWLRNDFFQQHCKLFHHRPFIWHIWDGRKRDGFHALVNYHRLAEGQAQARMLLENLTYSYLGDWITRQKDGVKRGAGGAEERLAAAMELKQRLEAILAGEPPFDIFVRWKPLAEQPIGWEPDINDGVRLNIRPFLASDLPNGRKGAGILRWKPNIKWGKDRGKEPRRERDQFPWFWGWDEGATDWMGAAEFDGNRYNACHYTIAVKREARAKNDTEKEVSR